jgi:hypothetical protein
MAALAELAELAAMVGLAAPLVAVKEARAGLAALAE